MCDWYATDSAWLPAVEGGAMVATVTVWLSDPVGEDSRLVNLAPGQEVVFGRGGPGCPVDLVFGDSAVSRHAGRIRAVEDHWTISNLSRHTTYVVENPEGGGEFLKVAPRRLDMPVPFEFARVVLLAASGTAWFQVFAPQHLYADVNDPQGRSEEATISAFPLDETAKYFLVLVALCEPALREGSSVAIPTAPQIVQRLSPLASCRGISVAAVHFHIDYLASHKLRVRPAGDGGAQSVRVDWQRNALVSLALRFNLVREEHLALLPSRLPGGLKAAGSSAESVAGRTEPGSS